MTEQTLIDLIMNAKLEQKIDVSTYNLFYIDVTFEDDDTQGDVSFTWTAHPKFDPWRNVFPLRNADYVKFWKTLNGAKRNFLRRIGKKSQEKQSKQRSKHDRSR